MNATLPHDPDAERAVLSSCLTELRAIDLVRDLVTPQAFYVEAHSRVYEACHSVHSTGQPVDVTTVCAWLRDRGWLQVIGGIAYVANLIDATPAVDHVTSHAKIVADKYRLRRLIEVCQTTIQRASQGRNLVADVLELAERDVRTVVSEGAYQIDAEWAYDLVRREIEELERIRSGQSLVSGIPYGLRPLDKIAHGLVPGELVVIAGRPGMGKSALGVNIAVNAAQSDHDGIKRGVLFASLEMTSRQLVQRALRSNSRVSTKRLQAGLETEEEWCRYTASAAELSQLPLKLVDKPRMRVSDIRAMTRRFQHEFDKSGQQVSVVVVDYIQRLGSDITRKDKFAEVSDNVNALADMAKELGVCVVALSQINRENTKRSGAAQRPRMSDLAESGEIEKAAHLIALIHRPEYYEQDKTRIPPEIQGLAEIVVDKNRDGNTGIVETKFDAENVVFLTPSENDYKLWTKGR